MTMQLTSIEGGGGEIIQSEDGAALIEYEGGAIGALYSLGVAFSAGSSGVECDLIEAHKWFNIAASKGHEEASWCRADIAEEMTAREIAEAQRRAREWLADSSRKAA
jgi:TPR repeat protein